VVGIGGEYERLRWEELWVLGYAEVVDQPAARKPGVFRTESLTVMSRSPIPSLIVERYEERNCQIAKLCLV
jgi:hypothetical protein